MALTDDIAGLATRIGEEVATKVTGTGITAMVALTQTEYDAIPTPRPATTFYVIVPE